jgi:hypothetical protein
MSTQLLRSRCRRIVSVLIRSIDCAFNNSTDCSTDEWVALVSGLDIGSDSGGEGLQLLSEYFSGELVNFSGEDCVSKITRVILAGNSLVAVNLTSTDSTVESPGKKPVRFSVSYFSLDSAADFSSATSHKRTYHPVQIACGYSVRTHL